MLLNLGLNWLVSKHVRHKESLCKEQYEWGFISKSIVCFYYRFTSLRRKLYLLILLLIIFLLLPFTSFFLFLLLISINFFFWSFLLISFCLLLFSFYHFLNVLRIHIDWINSKSCRCSERILFFDCTFVIFIKLMHSQ